MLGNESLMSLSVWGIKEADRLIEEALAGKGSIAAENQAVDELEQETQISSGNVGHSIYKT